jgi:hypothetical protein
MTNTLQSMSPRDIIVALRGEMMEARVAKAVHDGKLFEVFALGYQNYPEPQFFFLRIDSRTVYKNDVMLINYDEYALLDEYFTDEFRIVGDKLRNSLDMFYPEVWSSGV